MRTALYYPHTGIRNLSLIKNALLLWDRVEYIAPWQDFDIRERTHPKLAEALELISAPHVPTMEEQRIVHRRLAGVLAAGVPDWMITDKVPDSIKHYRGGHSSVEVGDFGIYTEKFAYPTWRLLKDAGLVRLSPKDRDYYMRPIVGLFVMSLLAEACAGSTKEQLTDQADAYSFLWKIAAVEGGANYGPARSILENRTYDRLVAVSIRTLSTNNIPLDNLLDLRRRELKSRGHDYRAFRQKYRDKLREYVQRLSTQARTASDWAEIERQFQMDLRDDLAALHDELRMSRRKLIFSKETAAMTTAAALLFVEPVSASVWASNLLKAVGWGALMKDTLDYSEGRQKALQGHAASWLYLAQNPRRGPAQQFI